MRFFVLPIFADVIICHPEDQNEGKKMKTYEVNERTYRKMRKC